MNWRYKYVIGVFMAGAGGGLLGTGVLLGEMILVVLGSIILVGGFILVIKGIYDKQ